MLLKIIRIGKIKTSFLLEAEQEYLKRLRPYTEIEQVTLKENIQSTQELTKEREAKIILESIQPKDYVVILTEHGKTFTTEKFSSHLKKLQENFPNKLVFLVAGPYGFHPSVLERAQEQLSLSPLTFTHEFAQVLLLEQIYRAYTIQTNKTYHY